MQIMCKTSRPGILEYGLFRSPLLTDADSGFARPVSVALGSDLCSPPEPTGVRSALRPAMLPPGGDCTRHQRPLATPPTSSCQTAWVCVSSSPLILLVIHSTNPSRLLTWAGVYPRRRPSSCCGYWSYSPGRGSGFRVRSSQARIAYLTEHLISG